MKLLTSVIRPSCRASSNKITTRFFRENTLSGEYAFPTEKVVKDVLQTSSVPFKNGHTCFQVKNCYWCKNTAKNSNSVDVFINKQTGFFLCQNCKIAGDWTQLNDLIKKSATDPSRVKFLKENFERYDLNTDWAAVEKTTESLSDMSEESYLKILNKFQLRPCSRSIIDHLKMRVSHDKNTLYFPLFCSESIVGYKTLDVNKEEHTFPRVNSPGLLTLSKPFRMYNEAVVVDNISDFLVLTALHLKYEIICLPYGTRLLTLSSLPFFEHYNKIILWLEDGSLDVVGNIIKKFNEKRCYVIKPTGNQKSASVAFEKNEDITNILASAKLSYHQFITTFSSFRDDLFTQLQNQEQMVGVPWKKFPQLTKLLKGHRRGEVTILTGPTGAGKTTFLSEYSLDLAMQGVNTLWGSFEIKNIRLARIMLTQFFGAPLPVNPVEYNTLCNKFEQLPIFFLTFHGQQCLEHVMDALHHCSYTYDIAHVLIDNIQFMIDVSNDNGNMDRFWRQDYMIQMFRSFASKYNCHITLVMHPKKTEGTDLGINSIFGGVKASQEADNILIIQNRVGMNYKKEKYLEVVKNRYFGDLGAFPLIFDKATFSFSKRGFQQSPNTEVFANKQVVAEEEEEEEELKDFNDYDDGFNESENESNDFKSLFSRT